YVPFLSLIVLPCSIVILICIPIIPFLAKRLADVLSIGLNLSNDFLIYCESLPFTRLNFGQTSILLVALYCVSIVSILMVWERRMSKRIM
ncbi:competence protein ComEC, partial [Bacillus cereus]